MAKKPQDTNKPKKIKLVRDSFCMPKDEYAAIDVLKTRAMGLSVSVKKSELLRAGLVALSRMSDAVLQKTLAAVPTIKTGRPSAEEAAAVADPAPPRALKVVKAVTPTVAAPKPRVAVKLAPKSAPEGAVKPVRRTATKPTAVAKPVSAASASARAK